VKQWIVLVASLGLWAAGAATQAAGVIIPEDRIQAVIGVMEIEDQDGELQNEDLAAEDTDVDIDFDNLFVLGIEVETPYSDRDASLEWGVNAGGGLSWKGNGTEFRGVINEGGARARYTIDNEMFVLEGHIGGYFRAHLGKYVDFYAGAGPAIIWASVNVDEDDVEGDEEIQDLLTTGGGTVILASDDDSDIIIGYYGRAGIEFATRDNAQWGIGVRYLGGELDFNDTVGEFDLEGLQILFTYSAWWD
jgi:opacity protein-like surface antigen